MRRASRDGTARNSIAPGPCRPLRLDYVSSPTSVPVGRRATRPSAIRDRINLGSPTQGPVDRVGFRPAAPRGRLGSDPIPDGDGDRQHHRSGRAAAVPGVPPRGSPGAAQEKRDASLDYLARLRRPSLSRTVIWRRPMAMNPWRCSSWSALFTASRDAPSPPASSRWEMGRPIGPRRHRAPRTRPRARRADARPGHRRRAP